MSRRERQKRRVRHHGRPLGRVLGMVVVLSVFGATTAALALVGWVVAVADSAPNLKDLKPSDPQPLTRIYASDGSLLGDVHSDNVFDYAAPGEIPDKLRDATVAIEDRRFWHHGALDYQGIMRAGIRDLFGSSNTLQGASTLTMQLVDNMYLDGTRYGKSHDLRYKIVQAKLAQQLEREHSKEWILDAYLNQVPYGTVNGETALGVGAASHVFFNKPASKLTLAQMALLAGLPQSPSNYNPFVSPSAARRRRAAVLQAMVSSHYITQHQASAAERQPLGVQKTTSYNEVKQPYVFDYVVQQLDQKLCPKTPHYCPAVNNGGLKVYTTIDLDKQQQAREAITSHEGGSVLDAQPAAALASVDASSGHILAIASSATYSQTAFDFATQAHRQPGSAFKVFALMTLIHNYHGDPNDTHYTSKFLPAGWLPSDPTWTVHTAENSYQGTINITKATVLSDNTVYAQLGVDVGPAKFDRMAHEMGITSQLNDLPAEVIGGLKLGVTPLEMADAYATIANGGWHVPPTIINKVVFPDGSTLHFGKPKRQQVFSDGEAYAAIQVLKGVISNGTGTAAGYGCPAAGKTGTAESMNNAWFVGFTPQLSTAVWVGYPQGNIPMGDGFGGTLAAPIWHDYMQQASDGYCGDWSDPSDPFQGAPFDGPHATSGASASESSSSSTGDTGGTGTGYYNPAYAPAPQPLAQSGGAAIGTGAAATGAPTATSTGSGR